MGEQHSFLVLGGVSSIVLGKVSEQLLGGIFRAIAMCAVDPRSSRNQEAERIMTILNSVPRGHRVDGAMDCFKFLLPC